MLGGQPWGYGLLRSVVLLVMLTSAIAEDSNIVILVRGEGGDGAGYLPLSPALTSVSKLAVEHVSEAAAAPGTNVTSIEVLEVLEDGIDAVVNLFEALDRDEGTFAVRKLCPHVIQPRDLHGGKAVFLTVCNLLERAERADGAYISPIS